MTQYTKNRNKLQNDTADVKSHYKLYRSGKNWMVAGITSVAFLMASPLIFGGTNAHADTTSVATELTSSTSSATTDSSSAETTSSASTTTDSSATSEVSSATSDATSSAATSSATQDASSAATDSSAATSSATATAGLSYREGEDHSESIANANVTIANNSLFSGIDSLKLNVTGTYTDQANIPVGSKISIQIGNPDNFDFTKVDRVNLPDYLTMSVDADNGTINFIYNSEITQEGALGFSITIPTVAYHDAQSTVTTTFTNGIATYIFDNANSTVTLTDPDTSDSVMVIYPSDFGEDNGATLISQSSTHTDGTTDNPGLDANGNTVKGNYLNIEATGDYQPDGNLIPVITEFRLGNYAGNADLIEVINLPLANIDIKDFINADGTVNAAKMISQQKGSFLGIISTTGNLDVDTASFKVVDKQTGEDLTSSFQIYEVSDGVYGFTVNGSLTHMTAALMHDFVITYNLVASDSDLSGSTATESMYWNTVQGSNYFGDNTTFKLSYNQNPSSTHFRPRLSGLADKTFVAGKAITDSDLLTNVTATDVEDGDLTPDIQITNYGGLDVTNPAVGSYTITVSVTDSDNNVTTGQEVITVVAPTEYTVTFHYVDEAGNTLKADTSKPGDANSSENVEAPAISGYTLKSVTGASTYNNADGTPAGAIVIWTSDHDVTFVYGEATVETGTVYVKYVDQVSGEVLDTQKFNGTVGQSVPFTTTAYAAANFENYHVAKDGTSNGATFNNGTQEFTVELAHNHTTVEDAVKTSYTVNYTSDDGKATLPSNNVQNATWSSDKDEVTGITTYSTTDKITTANTPDLKDYTADKGSVSFTVASSTTTKPSDQSETVTYKRTTFTPTNPGDMKDKLIHTVTETITYGPESGAAEETKSITFYRSAQQQKDGSFKYSEWTKDKSAADKATSFTYDETAKGQDSFDALTDLKTPAGYSATVTTSVDGTATNDAAGAVKVTTDNKTVTRTVKYDAKAATAKVVYLDQDDGNKQVGSQDLGGNIGDAIDFSTSDYLANNLAGYTVVSDGTAGGATYTAEAQTFTVVLKHHHTTNDNAANTSYTVNYTVDDSKVSAPASSVQNATWSSDTDDATGITTYSTSDKIASVATPSLKDYTADKSSVSFDVPGSTTTKPADQSQTVNYKRTTFTPTNPGDMEDDLIHTVTETITYGDPSTAADETHTITFYRSAQEQEDGSFKYSDWTTDIDEADNATSFNDTSAGASASFDAVNAADIDGYNKTVTTTVDGKATNDGANAVSVTQDNSTVTREVTYVTDESNTTVDGTAKVIYVDQDNDNKEVGSQTLTGQSGDAIEFSTDAYLAANLSGYELVSDGTADGAIYDAEDDTNGATQTFTVVLKHHHTTNENAANTSYTVNYTVNDGKVSAPESSVQNATWSSDTDDVTGVTTYSTSDKIASVTTPTLKDYTADKDSVSFDVASSTTTKPADQSADVTYKRTTFTPSNPGDMEDQLVHTVTETITYGDPSTAADETHTITFYRSAQEQDDGSFKYSDWTTDINEADNATSFSDTSAAGSASFDALTDLNTPDGYDASVATTVDGTATNDGAGEVDVTSANTTVVRTVTYTAQEPTNNGGGETTKPTTPTTPETTPTVETPSATPTVVPTATKPATTTPVAKAETGTLPQTGEANEGAAVALGAVSLTAMLTMFGIARRKQTK